MPKKREFQINPHKCQKVREVQIEIPQILKKCGENSNWNSTNAKKCGEIQIENLQMAKRSFLAFLVVPMDKKHSKTFPPLFRSNYIKSWCNLNSQEWIWKKLTKWLITDLIFFTFQNGVNTRHKIPAWKWTFSLSNFSFCWPFSQPKSSHTVDWSSRHLDLLCGGKKRVNGFLGHYSDYPIQFAPCPNSNSDNRNFLYVLRRKYNMNCNVIKNLFL